MPKDDDVMIVWWMMLRFWQHIKIGWSIMMRKLYKENCPSLWNDMKNEWYVDDDMKNNIVKMKCVLMMRLKWLNDAKDQWLYMRRKKKKLPQFAVSKYFSSGKFLIRSK